MSEASGAAGSPALLAERLDADPTRRVAGYPVRTGRPLPFGATVVPGGVNFSVYSNHATAMTLVLFRPGESEPIAELPFPPSCRIGGVYAMIVYGLDVETIEYGYRADGAFCPEQGHRFDRGQILTDPYAKIITGGETWGEPRATREYRAQAGYDDFEWEDDQPLNLPPEDIVVYELHVRGFTRHSSSAVSFPGTFAGLTEKIPYLRQLGVNCIELMPIFEFDEMSNPRSNPETGERLHDFWGYNPLGFFAPKAGYAATSRQGMQIEEFKNLVKQMHRAGIEVVLDVVFNHTAEGNEQGPSISFRGLDNSTYYMLTPDGDYYNFSGTGNTLNCNHSVVRGFVLDCLRYWVTEFHIDGFRFDLAAILGRAPDGSLLANPPLLESLAQDPILRDCKLIAEAWDAGGLYQVGSFPSYARWSEWNGRYRDAIRRFLKGDEDTAGEMAVRLVGSPDLYEGRTPTASVNFITAHDGFTLHDLVAYNDRHNEANGEDNRDGEQSNNSWNCGQEGPTDDAGIRALRDRQVRNALLLLLTSRGIPMLVAGDEAGRTQHGNNNAYCHDELSWFDWSLVQRNHGLVRFVRSAIAFRHAHPALRGSGCGESHAGTGRYPDVSWHGAQAWEADWSPHVKLLAAMFHADSDGTQDWVYLAANAYWESQDVALPEPPAGMAWCLFADTGAAAPDDVHEPGQEPPLADQTRASLHGRSVLVLTARPAAEPGMPPGAAAPPGASET
jgi:isoamylase